MTVWVVIEDDCECPFSIQKIFNSEEKAIAYKKKQEELWGYYEIESYEVE